MKILSFPFWKWEENNNSKENNSSTVMNDGGTHLLVKLQPSNIAFAVLVLESKIPEERHGTVSPWSSKLQKSGRLFYFKCRQLRLGHHKTLGILLLCINSTATCLYQVSLSPIVRQTRSKSSCPVAWKSIGRHQKENQWSARSPYSPSWTQALRPWCWSWRGRPCPPSSSWASGCAEAFVRKRWVGEKVADVGEKPK